MCFVLIVIAVEINLCILFNNLHGALFYLHVFLQSAQKVSGSSDARAQTVFSDKTNEKSEKSETLSGTRHAGAKMFQLTYKNNQARWSESG